MISCIICGRVTVLESEFCRYHQEALNNLRSSFENWRKASDVSWEEYIELLCQIDETGQWVREIAEQIRSGNGPSEST
ncbi:MAG: hypothetical protein ACFFCX_01080 [Candidatus Sifarchaeia archaeon]